MSQWEVTMDGLFDEITAKYMIGGISAAAGPIGTGGNISASLANPAPMFSYSRSKGQCSFKSSKDPDVVTGLFAGLTLDGTILVERKDANKAFYGSTISSTDILTSVHLRIPERITLLMYA